MTTYEKPHKTLCFYRFFTCSLLRAPFENLQKKHPNGLFERVVQQIALGTLFFELISVKMIPEGSPERSERRLGTLLGALGALLGRSWGALGRSWALWRRSGGALGALLDALGTLLGRSWAKIRKKVEGDPKFEVFLGGVLEGFWPS